VRYKLLCIRSRTLVLTKTTMTIMFLDIMLRRSSTLAYVMTFARSEKRKVTFVTVKRDYCCKFLTANYFLCIVSSEA